MKSIIFSLCLSMFFLIVSGCGKKPDDEQDVQFVKMDETKARITETRVFHGSAIGSCMKADEIYIMTRSAKKRLYLINIIGIDDFKVKRTVELPAGSFQSPTEYYLPSHVQRTGNRYCIVDQFHKILVYDSGLNYLYTAMYNQRRSFIDFFEYEDKLHFAIGKRHSTIQQLEFQLELMSIEKNMKPEPVKSLYYNDNTPSLFRCFKNSKDFHKGYFWPTLKGVVKKDSIYYSMGLEPVMYKYCIAGGTTSKIRLPFLKALKFSKKDARHVGYYKSGGWEEKFSKKNNLAVNYVPFPDHVYHFGLYDVGNDMIGVVTAPDLTTMTFRLDIIITPNSSAERYRYKGSIRLPFSRGFIDSTADKAKDFLKTVINLDKKIYIWADLDGDGERTVNLSKIEYSPQIQVVK